MLYAITDSELLPGEHLFSAVAAALAGGCTLIQYRDKSNDHARRLQDAKTLLQLCNQHNAKLIINDDVALAKETYAHGVHLGQGDGDAKIAREILGKNAIIGITCHDSLALAQNAIDDGASYIAFGRFFSSNTKPDARPATLELLRQARTQFPHTQIVAIGGITLENAKTVLDSGADMVAVCHNLFASQNIHQQAQLFAQLQKNEK